MPRGEDPVIAVGSSRLVGAHAAQALAFRRLLLLAVAVRPRRGGLRGRILGCDVRLFVLGDLARFLHLGRGRIGGLGGGRRGARRLVRRRRALRVTRFGGRREFVTEAERTQHAVLRRSEGRLIVDGVEQCRQRLGEALVEEASPTIDQRSRLLRHRGPGQTLAHQQDERLGHRGRAVGRAAQHTAALQVIAQRGVHIGRDAHQVACAHGLTADVLQRIEQHPRAGTGRTLCGMDRRIVEGASQREPVGLTARQGQRQRRELRRRRRQQHLVAFEPRACRAEDHLQLAVGGERTRRGPQGSFERAWGFGLGGDQRDLRGP